MISCSHSKSAIDSFVLSLNRLKKEEGFHDKKIIDVIKSPENSLLIPASIFSSKDAPFESLCNYLRESFGFPVREIARITKRDSKSIYTTLNNSCGRHQYVEDGIKVPLSAFCQRKTSILESLCLYLARKEGLGITEIGKIISKSPKTVWTAIHRARQKGGGINDL
ncbi:sigma-70 region 4 domain-containing protein [Candidatus Woesearchaeota archaeon]|nr:sigma-70 region 4 domain-containing protein [Candidatus Woesearchaeota archaeon]